MNLKMAAYYRETTAVVAQESGQIYIHVWWLLLRCKRASRDCPGEVTGGDVDGPATAAAISSRISWCTWSDDRAGGLVADTDCSCPSAIA